MVKRSEKSTSEKMEPFSKKSLFTDLLILEAAATPRNYTKTFSFLVLLVVLRRPGRKRSATQGVGHGPRPGVPGRVSKDRLSIVTALPVLGPTRESCSEYYLGEPSPGVLGEGSQLSHQVSEGRGSYHKTVCVHLRERLCV